MALERFAHFRLSPPPNRELRLTEIRRPEVSSRVRRPIKRKRRRICDALPSRPDDLLSARGILSNLLGRALPEKSISAPLRFLVTIYDTVTAVRPQSYLSLLRLIPKCYSNLSLGFKGTPRKRVSDCHRTETDNGGSVATLQLPRGSLAGCSSWRLRFALYSNGVNSTGGRPHGSGMVFALLAFCGVFAAPRPCFPKISGCFPRLMTECRSDSGCF